MVYQQRFSCLPHRPFRSDPDYSSFRHSDPIEDMVSIRTPHRASARVQQDYRVKAQYDALRGEFQVCYVEGLEVEEFIVKVLRLPKEQLDAIKATEDKWVFPSAGVKDYLGECDGSGNNESKLYPLFTRFAHRALKETTRRANNLLRFDDPCMFRLFERKGTFPFACEKTIRKPDAWLYRAPLADEDKAVWALVQNPFEFKKASSLPTPPSLFPKAHSERLPRATPPSAQKPRPVQSQLIFGHHEPEQSTSTSTISPNTEDSPESEDLCSTTAAGTITGGKRKRAALDDEQKKSKKKRIVTDARCQLMGYMGQCLRSTNRFYNIGFSVDRDEMSITYIDRMIGLRSSSFNFLKDRAIFAAIMYAIHVCNPQGMGFNTFLHATASPTLKSEPIQQMIGAFFHFPIRACSRIHSDDPRLSDGGDIPLALLKEPRSYVSFEVKKIILEPRGYTGRVTAVYRVTAIFPYGLTLELALKTSWQVEDDVRRPEAELIEGLVKDLPQKWRKHLPTVYFRDKYTSDDAELDLPSRSLGFEKDQKLWALDLRGYQILASKLYSRLIDASGPAEFIKVWLDCLKCHHAAYATGKVLHRDLSENNLMIDRCADEEGRMETIGVLNDWDMASRLDDTLQVPRSAATHRTGTLPFMSIQLLTHGKENEVRHRYRHDLESFFYILLCAVLFYDLKTHQMIQVPDKEDDIRKLRDWRGDDIEHNTNFKRNLFTTPRFYHGVVEDALKSRSQWAPYVNKYLNPIHSLLSNLYGYLQRSCTKAAPFAVASGDDAMVEDYQDEELEEEEDDEEEDEDEDDEDPLVRAENEQKTLDDMFNYDAFIKAIKIKKSS